MPGRPPLMRRIRKLWVKHLRDRITNPLHRQRVRNVALSPGYWRMLGPSALPVATRVRLLLQFLRIDWSIEHAHRPGEMAMLVREVAQRRAHPGEVFVEAGCWKGGSTAKFGLLCAELGLALHVYDSFEGVEAGHGIHPLDETLDFGGSFRGSIDEVRSAIARFGAPELTWLHPGWFKDTLAQHPVAEPVRAVYIDCDLPTGTFEVLQGVLPNLVPDAVVISQDMKIPSVADLLADPDTWEQLGVWPPAIGPIVWNSAKLLPAGNGWRKRGEPATPLT